MKTRLSLVAVGLLLATSAQAAVPGDKLAKGLDAQSYGQFVKTLSSDDFQGRLPATEGETKTLAYLESQFKALGLKPGFGDSFVQPVPLVSITSHPGSLTLGELKLDYLKDMVINSPKAVAKTDVKDAELVFVGYGIHAPELGWDDYQGQDVKGKVVVMLVNDPGYATGDSRFDGKAMTYYGRWDYKFDEAARQGAAGALIIHQTAPASYPWSVVQNSWSGARYDLAGQHMAQSDFSGWITEDAAKRLFAQAGLDFAATTADAGKAPMAKSLGAKASVHIDSEFKTTESHNLMALLPGKTEETIVVTAHWDHLGMDPSHTDDPIYNGAMDNATGTAGLISLARSLKDLYQGKDKPRRSVALLAVTAEEQGLLGSKYYVANPSIPLGKTVANINMDSLNVFGPTKDMVVVGQGKTSLEKELTEALRKQGRTLVPNDRPEAGGYYRSDHFNFAKAGIPALYAGGGSQPWNSDVAQYRDAMRERLKGCYHNACDQYQDDWDLRGALSDLQAFHDVIEALATSRDWPSWQPGAEFSRPEATD
ncbi:M28 family metallopeptidase [Gallaecimonas xiamenensis]|uniref:Putative Glutamate carboxypeptidase II n=1 Tax=Gallaecimonas xiamenensis 3-C-1 TaxID=745411 RepID=K2JLB8_9GAMM|nr:M28 family metallopeptidase [Gallaecimonas xiamenensis]EKE75177.1 putative Glutamate carboxypeptidase II [Gallaecimonas xiamenensis 3-C-1]